MDRKMANTIGFVLLATLINLVIMAILFLISFILLDRFVDPESEMMMFWIGIVFLFSIGGTFVIYLKGVKIVTEKYNLKEKLDPIFFKKRKDRRKRYNQQQ